MAVTFLVAGNLSSKTVRKCVRIERTEEKVLHKVGTQVTAMEGGGGKIDHDY